jgi:hypothetical protein
MNHTFHIPVLGLGYSIDTPLKVARYGITSVVSIVDDELTERMRQFHAQENKVDYTPIAKTEEDSRAKRITAYLNLLAELVASQFEQLKLQSFAAGNDIHNYFQLLPERSALKKLYLKMLTLSDSLEKKFLEKEIRSGMRPGGIDVNIMSKVDKVNYNAAGEALGNDYTDALAAMRGFANSNLESSVIISAGLNPRLYVYMEGCADFYPSAKGESRKKIVLKVSDYRSALIQAKMLAKKGLWVAEFRVESGLNCGGHAFATEGLLLGPILEEFKQKRSELYEELFHIYEAALLAKYRTAEIGDVEGRVVEGHIKGHTLANDVAHSAVSEGFLEGHAPGDRVANSGTAEGGVVKGQAPGGYFGKSYTVAAPAAFKITAQGGIGTAEEHNFLMDYYQLDAAGWGSPFLLVPEVTNVDEQTLEALANASAEDFYLSNSSPLGVLFNNFRKSSSEEQRLQRIAKGRPGSPCNKKFLSTNTEFTESPICTASREYQHLKIRELDKQELEPSEFNDRFEAITEKVCLCEGLCTSAYIKNRLLKPRENTAVSICPGPNLSYFSRVYSLKEMVAHIYGREEITFKMSRPNLFINELNLYVDYLKKDIALQLKDLNTKKAKYFEKFSEQLFKGIEYYRSIIPALKFSTLAQVQELQNQLMKAEVKLRLISQDIQR